MVDFHGKCTVGKIYQLSWILYGSCLKEEEGSERSFCVVNVTRMFFFFFWGELRLQMGKAIYFFVFFSKGTELEQNISDKTFTLIKNSEDF